MVSGKSATRSADANSALSSKRVLRMIKHNWSWYLFILVPVVGVIVFNFYPLAEVIRLSFLNARGGFIGTVNYEILFEDSLFRVSVVNTIYMGVLGIILNLPLAFILAVMLNRIRRGQSFFKMIFLLPIIMSMVSVVMIFKFIFSPDPAGIVNSFLALFGVEPQLWIASPAQARETVVMMAVWKNLGYNVILFFAGLQSVPEEYYEAASIDGANEAHKIWHITLPCIKNTMIFVYITTCIAVLRRFTEVYAISSEYGYPGNALMTIILYIYRQSFSTLFFQDIGRGSAAGVVLFIIIMLITALNFLVIDRDEAGIKVSRRRRRRI